jgi:Trm5-related predicted tRNA methylase
MMDGELESLQLQELRDSNAARWKQIESLHRQLQEEAVNGESSEKRPNEVLRAEIDLLSENGIYAQCDVLLGKLVSNDVTTIEEEDDNFAAEIVESFYQLCQTNQLLQESIELEQQKLETMEKLVEEHTEIQRVLQETSRKTEDSPQYPMEEDTPNSDTREEEENKLLKEDLRYMAMCIDGRKDQSDRQMKLDELVLKLTDRFLSSPEDPYVSTEDESILSEHIQLLKRCWMIESFNNDEKLIRLRDYSQ